MAALKVTPESIKEQGTKAQEIATHFKSVIDEIQGLYKRHEDLVGFNTTDNALSAKFAEIATHLENFKSFLDGYSQYLLRTVEIIEEQVELEKNNPDLFNAFK